MFFEGKDFDLRVEHKTPYYFNLGLRECVASYKIIKQDLTLKRRLSLWLQPLQLHKCNKESGFSWQIDGMMAG